MQCTLSLFKDKQFTPTQQNIQNCKFVMRNINTKIIINIHLTKQYFKHFTKQKLPQDHKVNHGKLWCLGLTNSLAHCLQFPPN